MPRKRYKRFKIFGWLQDREPHLDPETKQGVLVVFLFAFGFIIILSLFDLAGSVGGNIHHLLKLLFGRAPFILPLILIFLGYVLLNPEKYIIRFINYFGIFLFLLSFNGLLHLGLPLADSIATAQEGYGGGYLGLALSYPLLKMMGFWASLISLVALLVISILIMFNTTLERIIEHSQILSGFFNQLFNLPRKIFGFLPKKTFEYDEERDEDEDEDEYDEEEDDDETPSFTKRIMDGGLMKNKLGGEQAKLLEVKPSNIKPAYANKPIKIDMPLELLNGRPSKPTSGDIKNNMAVIEKTLRNFGLGVEMGPVQVGPTVTQFTLKPDEGIKLSQIITLHNDLALALAAHPIRIEAPIPGKSLVGVEVPNQKVAIVNLKEIIGSPEFKDRKSDLSISLGKDVAGNPWVADLDKMPHLLVAGATGSGKTVMINSLLISLLYQNSQADLKFILVDPKRVELTLYEGIPHLLTPVITEVSKTINALKWTINEMERRFELLSKLGKRNIQTYNHEAAEKLPYIVFVIDELADLMTTAGVEVEAAIIRLAQMARAVGIHLVLATQRPSVDIITGLIKANITSRIAFSVASLVDSRTILDTAGAEKLLGRGDMLYISSELSKPKRLQGAYVADEEIKRVVDYLKNQGVPEYTEKVVEKQSLGSSLIMTGDSEDGDELLEESKGVIRQAGKASASLLQRRLRVGYARAARILDLLEMQGYIGPADGAKPREILDALDEEEVEREGYGEDPSTKLRTEEEGEYEEDDEE